jgi:peptidoglycan-associated lipoprotein
MVLLALASVLLAGCPKSPTPGALNSAGSPSGLAGQGIRAGAGSPSTGTGAGAGQGGPSGVHPASTATVGAGGTGTTLPAVPSPTEFVALSALRDVHFEFDKYDIRPAEKSALDTNVRWLKAHARALVLIEGHGDERGTNEYNLALGERRAQATRAYLASAGVTDSPCSRPMPRLAASSISMATILWRVRPITTQMRSASVAIAVKVTGTRRHACLFPIGASTGAWFTSSTVIWIVSESARLPVPSHLWPGRSVCFTC